MDELFNQNNSSEGNPLEELVGEGKKFATVEDMAKGKLEADRHIERLNAELAAKEETTSKLNELLEAVKSRGANPTIADPDPTPGSTDGKEPTSTFNPEDIEALVSKKLEQASKEAQRNRNTKEVADALTKAYGEKSRDVVATRMSELDMTPDQVTELAASNPKAFSNLFLSQSTSTATRFEGVKRVDPDVKPASTGKGWSYFRDLKKKSPSQFHSPRVQKEFNDSVDAKGSDAFFAS